MGRRLVLLVLPGPPRRDNFHSWVCNSGLAETVGTVFDDVFTALIDANHDNNDDLDVRSFPGFLGVTVQQSESSLMRSVVAGIEELTKHTLDGRRRTSSPRSRWPTLWKASAACQCQVREILLGCSQSAAQLPSAQLPSAAHSSWGATGRCDLALPQPSSPLRNARLRTAASPLSTVRSARACRKDLRQAHGGACFSESGTVRSRHLQQDPSTSNTSLVALLPHSASRALLLS